MSHTRYGRRMRRGNTLVVSVIMGAVLTVVAAGYVRRSQTVVDGIVAKRNYDASLSCAEASRQLLLSKFQAIGGSIPDLVMNTKVAGKTFASGRYGAIGVKSITPIATSSALGSSGGSTEAGGGSTLRQSALGGIVNALGGGGGGAGGAGGSGSSGGASGASGRPGQLYKMTVICADDTGNGRQSEVEFTLRFGL